MKEKLALLLIEIGLFFANCDGDYDPREKKFIANFLKSLELNHILEPGLYNKEALERTEVKDFHVVTANMNDFVSKLQSDEKQPFRDMIDSFIQGIIKADNVIATQETYYYNMWKENVKS